MAILKFEPIRTVAFGAITSSYTNFGAVTAHGWRMFKVTNNTNGDILISLAGGTDAIFVPAGGFTLYDVATNSAPISGGIDNFVVGAQVQFQIKYSTAPTSGAVWLEGGYS